MFGLHSSGTAFISKLSQVMCYLGYGPPKRDSNMWIKTVPNANMYKYYQMVLCCKDDVTGITEDPMEVTEGVEAVFKLKSDHIAKQTIFLWNYISKVQLQTCKAFSKRKVWDWYPSVWYFSNPEIIPQKTCLNTLRLQEQNIISN